MDSHLNWDDFRLVKAVAEARALVGAAETLGLNHSTVFRRLGALETALGARLFERSRNGYQATAAGEEMAGIAARMFDSIADFERRVAGRDVKPSGDLKVTTVDTIGVVLMPPIFAAFRRACPDVRLDLILAQHQLNLSRREADVAIRVAREPPPQLVGRRVATMRWAVYASPRLVAHYGDDLVERAPWVGFGDEFGPHSGRRWLERNIGEKRQIYRANTAQTMAQFIANDGGAGLLPCFLADSAPDIQRFGEVVRELDAGLWVLAHADLVHSAKVRAFLDLASDELAKMRATIEGE